MNELFGLLHDLSELAFEIGRVAAGRTTRAAWSIVRRISIVARLAIVWPFALLLIALPSWKYWPVQYIVLTTTILILLAFLFMMTAPAPLSILVAETMLSPKTRIVGDFVEKARKATNAIRIVLGLELIAGIYFSWVPIANNRPLALTQILIVAAIVCFIGIKKWEPVVAVLVVAFCVITLVFLWGEISNLHPEEVFAAHLNRDDDLVGKFQKPVLGQETNQAPPPSEPKRSEPNQSEAPPVVDTPDPPAATQWFKPVSGNEGAYTVRISSGRYLAPGKVGFWLSIQPPDESESETLYIDESDGGDNRGSFSAYPNAIAENYIHCAGPSTPCNMPSGQPTYLKVNVDRPNGVDTLSFTLKIAPGGMAWIRYDFAKIPVLER